jgi:RNA polymerase sigma factor (TIGR02999 family)
LRITGPLPDVTGQLLAWRGGDEEALSRLIPAIERELHRIARRCMAAERVGHSLQATALVNEAYIRLIDVRQMIWQNRAHFPAMAARVMRRILVDSARAKRNQKRGGGDVRITFDEGLVVAGNTSPDLVTTIGGALCTQLRESADAKLVDQARCLRRIRVGPVLLDGTESSDRLKHVSRFARNLRNRRRIRALLDLFPTSRVCFWRGGVATKRR